MAAAIAACLLFGAIWLRRSPTLENIAARQNQTNNHAEIPRPTNSPVIQAVQITWQEMMHSAIGNRENCALNYNLLDEPITLPEAAEKYGGFNKNLDKTIVDALKGEVSDEKTSGKLVGKLEVIDAHSCVYNGRRFPRRVSWGWRSKPQSPPICPAASAGQVPPRGRAEV